jgi:serine/threonine protein kinase
MLACAVLAPGTLLRDKYRLDREIGRGGMGSVWRATRIDLGTDLAVKVMHGGASQRAAALGRFEREAKAAASLSSPHVVRIIDFGIDEVSAHAFLAMELLVGESLDERLKRNGRLAPALVASVVTQVGRALNQAHGLGIVHRDLKPANVFLVRNEDEDMVKLLDFGIAKAEGGMDEALLTETGNVLGTPHYMSPEQLSSSRGVDHRADLWSLAIIACECLTGQRPFRADSLGELAMRISIGRCEPPSSVASVPVGFDAWFARATQIDPAQRFQSASQLSAALTALVAASDGRGQLSGASAALDPTLLASDIAAAPRPPSGASAAASNPVAAAPTLATLSTTSMSSVLSTAEQSDGERARHRRRRARLAWLAAAVTVSAVVGAASLRAWTSSPASSNDDGATSAAGSQQTDPLPPPPRAETLPVSSTPDPQMSTRGAPTAPAEAIAVPERAEAASVSTATAGLPSARSSSAATQSRRLAVTPSALPKRTLTGTAARARSGRARAATKEHVDAYDWQ